MKTKFLNIFTIMFFSFLQLAKKNLQIPTKLLIHQNQMTIILRFHPRTITLLNMH